MKEDSHSAASPAPSAVQTIAPELITGWAEQRLVQPSRADLPRLTEVFKNILSTANEYIATESGSICLIGLPCAGEDLLYVAAFGSRADLITGTRLPVSEGVTGHVFREGKAAMINNAQKDRHFYAAIDERSDYTTRSILAVPVFIDGNPCGVISLFNRSGNKRFTRRNLRLLEVLAGYASNSLLNLADASHHREVARRDDLTGLRNDRFFHHQLRVELEARERTDADLSLLFLDLDRFKAVVDTHGHLVGSQVLAEVGRLIARVVPDPAATLARYGGDEYVVILPGVAAAEAAEKAEAIRRGIAETTFLATPGEDGRPALNLKGAFSASIGVASYRDCPFAKEPVTDWKVRQRDFIQVADLAMYEAKASGRDRVWVG
jgi:diguanylate cyclase (GGDEF)-like protein